MLKQLLPTPTSAVPGPGGGGTSWFKEPRHWTVEQGKRLLWTCHPDGLGLMDVGKTLHA